MSRVPAKVMELPEVRPATHPNVECAIHPGHAVKGVAICVHVLAGDSVYLKAEPDRDAWGAMLCEECASIDRKYLRLRLACEKCVRYHFSSCEQPEEQPVDDIDMLATAEGAGMLAYQRVRSGFRGTVRNPFSTPLARYAWNLGFRLAKYLDECTNALADPVPH